MCLLLQACSGGGGGTSTIGSGGSGSLPAPPVATNTSIADLKVSQSFASDAATDTIVLDLPSGNGVRMAASNGTLAIAYDADTRAYSLAYADRSQRFAPADVSKETTNDVVYRKTIEGSPDYLTLVKAGYSNLPATSYVRLGYWQRNTVSNGQQFSDFVVFAYGLASAAGALPRTGTAAYQIDTFGVVGRPGSQPRVIEGNGVFSLDLDQGLFAARSSLLEGELVSGAIGSGGLIEMRAAGTLSSTDGTFSGTVAYGSGLGTATGALTGRFYGPKGEELGAAFWANGGGLSVNGGFTGIRTPGLAFENFTLTNLVGEQAFYTRYGGRSGSLLWQGTDSFTASPGLSDMLGGAFSAADKIASANPNLTTYRKTFTSGSDTQQVTLSLYKPGPANTELALTYASFGNWVATPDLSTHGGPIDEYFVYGFSTPPNALSSRTGTAEYQGVVYGRAKTFNTGDLYTVGGTSRFSVDFGALRMSGSLDLVGKASGGGPDANFGNFAFAAPVSSYQANAEATFQRNGLPIGGLVATFYGPTASEIGATFAMTVPATGTRGETYVTGATVAK